MQSSIPLTLLIANNESFLQQFNQTFFLAVAWDLGLYGSHILHVICPITQSPRTVLVFEGSEG